jgi:hypothetical protein
MMVDNRTVEDDERAPGGNGVAQDAELSESHTLLN